jgi:hypothetical protein
MKVICAYVNFDFFMPKTPSAARAAKLEFPRKERSTKPEAGQVELNLFNAHKATVHKLRTR